MSCARGWIPVLVAVLLGWGPPPLAAAASEKAVFEAAANALKDGFHERAEVWFAEFVATYTNSARVPEAILCQAEARLELTNYAGALELLTTNANTAGKWAGKYLFYQAEVFRRKGEYATAADLFGKLVAQYPASSRRLEAAIGEADARSKLGEWERVEQLLQQADGVFQGALRGNGTNEWVWHGCLLLAEAQLGRKEYAAAEQALAPLAKAALPPLLSWRRQYLLCRAEAAQQRWEEALQGATNLVGLAGKTGRRPLVAESTTFEAGLLERLGRIDEAIRAYTNNLADGFPTEHQRQALLKITELSLARNQVGAAAQTLDWFCTRYPEAASADLALLTLGELRLRQYIGGETNRFEAASTNAPFVTNRLQQAEAALNAVVTKKSPLVGKAQLDLGWCLWLENKWPECQAACLAALPHLAAPLDRATAHFKLADAQYRQKDYASALTNYHAIVALCGQSPELKTNLCEPALYQAVRAGLAAADLPAATNALGKLLTWFPAGFYTDRALLQTGQELCRKDPAQARQIFTDYIQQMPEDGLVPELRLVMARTYEQESKWPAALREYESWLERYTNSAARARAEYYRAFAGYQAGDTNALAYFTNFVARFPTNEFTPLAQWWVADYYFRNNDPVKAELAYKVLLQTNWPVSELTYQARMMAGRAALKKERWADAIEHFTNLTSLAIGPKFPVSIWVQAMFAYGDTLVTQDATNYDLAARVFNRIVQDYPTNPVAPLALGERANCLLQQWAQAARQPDAATNALAAFREVVSHPRADFAARSIARLGIATVLQKQADLAPPAMQAGLLKEALSQCLIAFYYEKDLRPGEEADWFWIKKAGLEAAGLAERLQDWSAAINVYRRLKELLPPLSGTLDKKIAKAQESLARTKN